MLLWPPQRRAWRQNLCLVGLPLVFCMLLLVIQRIVNSEIGGSSEFRCGCKCLECCDWELPPTGDERAPTRIKDDMRRLGWPGLVTG